MQNTRRTSPPRGSRTVPCSAPSIDTGGSQPIDSLWRSRVLDRSGSDGDRRVRPYRVFGPQPARRLRYERDAGRCLPRSRSGSRPGTPRTPCSPATSETGNSSLRTLPALFSSPTGYTRFARVAELEATGHSRYAPGVIADDTNSPKCRIIQAFERAWTCSAMAVKPAQTASCERASSGTPGQPVDLVVAMLTPGRAFSLSRMFNLASSEAKAGSFFRYCSAVSIFTELRRMKKGQVVLPSRRSRHANIAP
jgi:hypothetical protein